MKNSNWTRVVKLRDVVVVLVMVVGVVVGAYSITRTQLGYKSKAAPQALVPVPATFNGVLTHLDFFARDGQQYVGKRYFGTKGNALSSDHKFMKVWSGPIDCGVSPTRQLVYHWYLGWDDAWGKIAEWESWRRDPGNVLTGLKLGGQYMNASYPHWPCGWMNGYSATGTQVASTQYNCQNSQQPVPGLEWPVMYQGMKKVVYKSTNKSNTCQPDGNPSHYEYQATAYREDFGTPYSLIREQKCYRYVHPVWGRGNNAYNICLDAPYVGYFEQRYAWYLAPNWRYSCEPLIYVWGYPENGSTHKAFRNGELRYADYVTFNASPTFYSPDDANEGFWQDGCNRVWFGIGDKGGWIYAGEYQIGTNFYVDKGDANTPPTQVSRYTPNPTPTPWTATRTWYEPKCGFIGEEWCMVGTSCTTDWIGGPTVEVICPTNSKLKTTGTAWARWDGLRKWSGSVTCEVRPECQ